MPLNVLTFGRPSRKGRPPKEILEREFNVDCLSIRELADQYKVSQPCISKWLASYGIRKTPNSRANTIERGVQRLYGKKNVMFVEKHFKTYMANLHEGVKSGTFIMKGSKFDQPYLSEDYEFDGRKILEALGAYE